MKSNPQRDAYLKRRREEHERLGVTTHPAAPGPDESEDDKRKNRNARKQKRRARRK